MFISKSSVNQFIPLPLNAFNAEAMELCKQTAAIDKKSFVPKSFNISFK